MTTESDLCLGSPQSFRQRQDESKVLTERSQDPSSGVSPPTTPRLGGSEDDRLIRIFGPSGLPKTPGLKRKDDTFPQEYANIAKNQKNVMLPQPPTIIVQSQEKKLDSDILAGVWQKAIQENGLEPWQRIISENAFQENSSESWQRLMRGAFSAEFQSLYLN